MNVTVFEAINITKKYRNTLALNQVSMSVMQGDIYGFIGENGAGKTTMIHLLPDWQNLLLAKLLYSVKAIRNLQSSVSALAVLLKALLFILI